MQNDAQYWFGDPNIMNGIAVHHVIFFVMNNS